jgi:molybdopterin-guanine dinucleotide biosynthesis protein A
VEQGWPGVAVVVLAGGGSRRLGGRDKLTSPFPGEHDAGTLLDAVLAGIPEPVPVVLVGPPRPTARPVTTARERPPGGGPAAAVAAGARALTAAPAVVVVLAGDAPFAPRAVSRLLAALGADPDAEVAVAVDRTGRVQPLLAAYRAGVLRRVTAGDLAGRPARSLLDGLRLAAVEVDAETALDVDTAGDLDAARRTARAARPS